MKDDDICPLTRLPCAYPRRQCCLIKIQEQIIRARLISINTTCARLKGLPQIESEKNCLGQAADFLPCLCEQCKMPKIMDCKISWIHGDEMGIEFGPIPKSGAMDIQAGLN